ncbi:hypothetical protein [Lactiplantibacillus herbarum]|uniref:hypothetical protein n=1 Tax=Lactiplantibacillus herbarum TaxID=1670446 RepID=UPI00064F13F5|nr:hypothetical protein [Lactiplantibacillus herbarum]
MLNVNALNKLNEIDKLMLSQMIMVGYDAGQLEANASAAIENLLGHKLGANLDDDYSDLLKLFRLLGGEFGMINYSGLTFSKADLDRLKSMKNYSEMQKFIWENYGQRVEVIPAPFDRYLFIKCLDN